VKILSCGEQNVSSDEEENISDNSSMQHGIYGQSQVLIECFPFTGKPVLNFDFEEPSNPLEYFELFCTPEIEKAIARETSRYAQRFLENTPNLN
jgi:hypothetical protein